MVDKKKRDFQGSKRLKRPVFFAGLVGLALAIYIGFTTRQKPMPPQTVVSPISLDLTCLETLTEQNIDQMEMLEPYKIEYGSGWGARVRWSADGSLLAFTRYFGLSIIDFDAKRQIDFWQTNIQDGFDAERGANGSDFVLSADSHFALTYARTRRKEGGLKLWDVASASLVREISTENTYLAAMSADNRFITFSTQSETYWIDLSQDKEQKHLLTPYRATTMAFNPIRSEELFLGSEKGVSVFHLSQANPENLVPTGETIQSDAPRPGWFEISPDGMWLFTSGALTVNTTNIKVLNLKTGQEENSISGGRYLYWSILDWNKHLLIYGDTLENETHYVTVFDLRSNAPLFQHTLVAGEFTLFHYPMEPLIAFFDRSTQTIKVWNYETGQEIRVFQLPKGESMHQAQFNAQGTLLAFMDQTSVQLWGHKAC